ncbi:MAG: Ldh family oxidoreductase, partial [Sediminibacterium sp.]
FKPAEDFKNHMDHWINRFRNATPVEGQEKVIIPGDPEREMEITRMRMGIPLLPIIVEDLEKTGGLFEVSLTK